MNIALEDTEEEVDGITRQRFGDSFIRGNNGMTAFVDLPLSAFSHFLSFFSV